jgi:hypothetical protein
MPWANLDDRFATHPKIVALSDAAFRLHVAGVLHASQHLTDGGVHTDSVGLLVPRYRKSTLDELLRKGVWHDKGEGCGTEECPLGAPETYQIHDYLEWNKPRDVVTAERDRLRELRSKAGKKGAASRWGTK